MRHLVGVRVPQVTLARGDERGRDPLGEAEWTVLFFYPGAHASSRAYPTGWTAIPGAAGCTLEAATFRHHIDAFAAVDAEVVGVSTQPPDEQAAFAAKARLPYTLLSDQELRLAAALRLPTFRVAGRDHLKRLTLIVGADREIRHVLFPIADPAASVGQALRLLERIHAPTTAGK